MALIEQIDKKKLYDSAKENEPYMVIQQIQTIIRTMMHKQSIRKKTKRIHFHSY